MNLEEIRQQYPQYANVSDGQLAAALHQKFYPDMPMGEFSMRVGLPQGAFKEMVEARKAQGAEPTARAISADHETPMGGMRSAFQGATLGFGDEIVAGGAAAMDALGGKDIGRAYTDQLNAERQRIDDYRQTDPGKAMAAEVGGALMMPLGAMGAGGNMAAQVGKSAGMGAGMAGVYGFGAGEGGAENRLTGAAQAAPMGGAFGAAAPLVGGVAKKAYEALPKRKAIVELLKNAPASTALRAQADDAYARADAASPVPREAFAGAADEMLEAASRRGLDADLMPKSGFVASRVEDVATSPNGPISFGEIDRLRQKAGNAAMDAQGRADRAISTSFVKGIDDFIESTSDQMGDAAKEARDLWKRLRKSEKISEIIENTDGYLAGGESGLRNQFASILKNPNKRKGWTKDELAVMREVINGRGVFDRLVRMVGRYGVAASGGNNALGAGMGAGGGAAIGGAIGGFPGAVIGALSGPTIATGSRLLGERNTARSAEILKALAASGGKMDHKKLSPEARALIEALMRREGAVAAQ